MPDSVLLEPPPVLADSHGGGRGRSDDGRRDDGGGGGGSGEPSLPINNARLVTILGLIASTMLFSGLFGAFVMLQGSAKEWPRAGIPELPGRLWINTLLVVASSAALVVAHVAQRRGRAAMFRGGMVVALAGAIGFVAMQSWIWRALVERGFALATSHTDNEMGRFYLLTGAHLLHALVGSLLLLVTTIRALRGTPLPRLSVSVDVTAILWHFVGVAWIAVWILLTS
jgi:cytochrome c oxidase subunit 3